MRALASLLFVITAFAVSVPAQSPVRLPITAGQVARALSDSGIATSATQVSLPPGLVAATLAPVLNIISIEPPLQRRPADHSASPSRVRIECGSPAQCLPFYALVRWPQATIPGPYPNVAGAAKSNFTIRAGTPATLILDDHRSHIEVAVISLENGMVGQQIHVTSVDHRHFYFGEVIRANLLRGSF